jgi:hypothetical protein
LVCIGVAECNWELAHGIFVIANRRLTPAVPCQSIRRSRKRSPNRENQRSSTKLDVRNRDLQPTRQRGGIIGWMRILGKQRCVWIGATGRFRAESEFIPQAGPRGGRQTSSAHTSRHNLQ